MTVVEAMTEITVIKSEILVKLLDADKALIPPALREVYKRRIAAIDVMLVSRGLAQ